MATSAVVELARLEGWPDDEVVRRVLAGEIEMFEIIMRRYNSRLFRVALSIVRNEAEAEDIVQDAYVRAYVHLDQFEARAQFSTWLTRIAVHEALARAKRRNRQEPLEEEDSPGTLMTRMRSPEQSASDKELKMLIESAILTLPAKYCTVLIMRDVQEMDTAETAACLGISEENVKVRLHRARAILRRELYARAGGNLTRAFGFDGDRCDRMVAGVFRRLNEIVRR
ncbi:MAG TPA: RNA polymerase sigma factor [Terriglobales bacterium]|nr:RNA polymerase sigma factor [Terriglobales bacterium]